jgi:Electron transfer DM13.
MSRRQRAVIISSVVFVGALALGVFALGNILQPPPVEVVQPDQIAPPPTTEVAPDIDNEEPVVALRTGSFVDGDAIHRGSGTVSVVHDGDESLLVFSDDVSITPGPDLLVYLSPNAPGEELGEFVSLGGLKSSMGEQTYLLPENSDDFHTVVIWCRAFAVAFATAQLG